LIDVAKKSAEADVNRLSERLSDELKATVKIMANRQGTGRLQVHFSSLEDLDVLIKKLAPEFQI
jgi:hypothetical protein